MIDNINDKVLEIIQEKSSEKINILVKDTQVTFLE